MKIAIVGTGYVGLITGISLAELGHRVLCIDTEKRKVSMINKGQSPFFEPGIDKYLKQVLKNGTLLATENLEEAVLTSDITIIAVGTPTINNGIDLSAIKNASRQIGEALKKVKKYHVVAVKSTVLPGATDKVVKPILEKYSQKKVGAFGLCMNPEFLREGSAIEDALNPDRIIIGQIDEKSGREFAKIYTKISAPIIFTNLSTAELTKYASNVLFATLISYANEIARISENAGKIDVVDVWNGVHLDKRLSPVDGKKRIKPGVLNYIFSGCGYGGSCLPKDTKALSSFADEIGAQTSLIKSVIDVNRSQPHRIILLLKNVISSLRDKKVAVLGLAFKPNTDDIRESVSIPIIEELISQKATVFCHDPKAYKDNIPPQLANLSITLSNSVEEAIKNADAVMIVTAWEEYLKLPPQFFKKHMKNPVVIDGRRIYDKNLFLDAGITYKGIGT